MSKHADFYLKKSRLYINNMVNYSLLVQRRDTETESQRDRDREINIHKSYAQKQFGKSSEKKKQKLNWVLKDRIAGEKMHMR